MWSDGLRVRAAYAGRVTSPLSRALPLLRFLIHLLVAGLLAITGVAAVVDGPRWDVVAAALPVAGVYAAGRLVQYRPGLVPVWGAALPTTWPIGRAAWRGRVCQEWSI